MKKTLLTLIGLALIPAAAMAGMPEIEAALMDKNYEEVRHLSQKLLKTQTDAKTRIQAEYYLGLSQVRLGQYAKARSAFNIVMSSAKDEDMYTRAALGMVEALYIPGSYKEAMRTVDALLGKYPKSASLSLIYLKKARIYLKQSQWKEARDYLQKILTEYPNTVEAPIARTLMEEKEFYTVQVGSFLEQDKAVHLMEELKANGQYAYIVETVSPDNQKFYRVRVGQSTSMSDTQNLEAKLSKLGYPTLIYP